MSSPYYRQFRREFGRGYYRPSRRMTAGPAIAIGAAVLLGAAGAVGHGHVGTHRPAVAAAAIPAVPASVPSAGYTPSTWTVAFIHDLGDQATACNVAFVRAWIGAEGSNWVWRNPLDDELPEPGSYRVNDTGGGHGVQAYPTWREDLAATVRTFNGPDYSSIRAAVSAGNNAQRAADAVAQSPWGTEVFEASC